LIKNIPDGWRVEKLVNISSILDGDRGKNYPKQEDFSDNGYCLFLTTKNVSKKGFNFTSTQFISKNKDEILRKGRLERNDLVITTRGTVGNIAFFNQNVPFDIIRINSGMAIIRITIKDLTYSFVNTYFRSNIFYRYVSEIISGSAQPQITITKLKNLLIPIPPLQQQKKIVKVLDISSALIEKQKELLAKYDLFLKSKFIKMFGDPVLNPMGWEVEKLKEILLNIDSGWSPVCQNKRRKNTNNGILKLSALSNDVYNYLENKEMIDDIEPKINNLVSDGDLLFSRKNTYMLVGSCAYVYQTEDNLFIPDLIFRLNTKDTVNKIFLWKYLSNEIVKVQLRNIANGAAASMPNISKTKLLDFKILLPTIDLQNKFAKIVEKIETIKTKETQKLEHLETLHSSLMDKAFRGEIQ